MNTRLFTYKPTRSFSLRLKEFQEGSSLSSYITFFVIGFGELAKRQGRDIENQYHPIGILCKSAYL